MALKDQDLLNFLREIYAQAIVATAPTGSNPMDWARGQGLVRSDIGIADGRVVGLKAEAIIAAGHLSRAIRGSSDEYRSGTTPQAFATKVVEILLSEIGQRHIRVPDQPELNSLRNTLKGWFDETAKPRLHAIPCAVMLYPTARFAVGPIRFVQRHDVTPADLGLPEQLDLALALSSIDQMMVARSANWLAIVTVPKAEPLRSREIAEGAVDVAIAGIQLIMNRDAFKFAVRITGRSMPPNLASFSQSEGSTSTSSSNIMAGLAIAPSLFETALAAASPIVDSVGNRLNSYLGVSHTQPKLQRSWCDATFWYHEALAEPLATVAIAKLETALEALFAAGNASGSSQRLRQVIKAIFDLESGDPLYTGSPVTVSEFVKDLVEARSRILHGTWSTLSGELPVEVGPIATLCREVLLAFTLQLDAYAADTDNADDIKAFVTWLEAHAAARWASLQGSAG